MCAGPEGAVKRDGLLLSGGVTAGRGECATDLLAVDEYRERGIALGIADAIAVGIGILTDLEHQTVGAGAEGDRCRGWGWINDAPPRLTGGNGGTTEAPPPLTEFGPWLRMTSITGTIFAISARICWISGLFSFSGVE